MMKIWEFWSRLGSKVSLEQGHGVQGFVPNPAIRLRVMTLNGPIPCQSLHPPVSKMKRSEVWELWAFLKCVESFQDSNKNWNKPVQNASRPCGRPTCLHDVSLPMEVCRIQRLLASLCLLMWFHFLCHFPSPCPAPDKGNKATDKLP